MLQKKRSFDQMTPVKNNEPKKGESNLILHNADNPSLHSSYGPERQRL